MLRKDGSTLIRITPSLNRNGKWLTFVAPKLLAPEPDFPIGLRGLSLGPRGEGGPAVGPPTWKKERRKKERKKERERMTERQRDKKKTQKKKIIE